MDENLLRTLFDFQRFAGNKQLDDLIRAAGEPYAEEAGNAVPLDDDELEWNAAGEPEARRIQKEFGGPS